MAAGSHDRLVLELDEGELRYRNMRRLGGIWLARDERRLEEIEGPLGPDWLDVPGADFDEFVAGGRASIKEETHSRARSRARPTSAAASRPSTPIETPDC
jgi:formamidopyrimidine-DNA glycosylase